MYAKFSESDFQKKTFRCVEALQRLTELLLLLVVIVTGPKVAIGLKVVTGQKVVSGLGLAASWSSTSSSCWSSVCVDVDEPVSLSPLTVSSSSSSSSLSPASSQLSVVDCVGDMFNAFITSSISDAPKSKPTYRHKQIDIQTDLGTCILTHRHTDSPMDKRTDLRDLKTQKPIVRHTTTYRPKYRHKDDLRTGHANWSKDTKTNIRRNTNWHTGEQRDRWIKTHRDRQVNRDRDRWMEKHREADGWMMRLVTHWEDTDRWT